MKYFGIPMCPYCRKHVNLLRTWRLKKEGEYRCPRCGGISNVYLSPLVYVFSVMAVCIGVCIYFFHKFVLNDIQLTTCLNIFIPFAAFFLISLFCVYLKKPVIKRVQRPAPAQPTTAGRHQRAYRSENFAEIDTGRYDATRYQAPSREAMERHTDSANRYSQSSTATSSARLHAIEERERALRQQQVTRSLYEPPAEPLHSAPIPHTQTTEQDIHRDL